MGTQTRSRLPVDERREQLLELGLELFSQRAYETVSIDEIAEAAGISRGLLYHYFPSKRDFYLAVLGRAVDELVELTAPDPGAPPETRLRRSLQAHLDYVERHRLGYLTVMQAAGSDPDVRDLVERARSTAIERILAGMGVTDPVPALRAGLRGWIGFVEGIVQTWLDGTAVTRDEVVEICISVLGTVLVTLSVEAGGHA